MSYVEAEQESSAASSGILSDLLAGYIESAGHTDIACNIFLAMDLIMAETKGFDAFL